MQLKEDTTTVWDTAAGKMTTTKKAKVKFCLSEFDERKEITWNFHITNSHLRYDMIIGRDIMNEHGKYINFKEGMMYWNHTMAPLKSPDAMVKEAYVLDSSHVEEVTDRIKQILDAKYEPANLDKVVEGCSHLTKDKRQKLLNY